MPFRRKYFWARMSTATWDQLSGTSTSLASNTTLPSSLVIRLVRAAKGIPASGSLPSLVKKRVIFMTSSGKVNKTGKPTACPPCAPLSGA